MDVHLSAFGYLSTEHWAPSTSWLTRKTQLAVVVTPPNLYVDSNIYVIIGHVNRINRLGKRWQTHVSNKKKNIYISTCNAIVNIQLSKENFLFHNKYKEKSFVRHIRSFFIFAEYEKILRHEKHSCQHAHTPIEQRNSERICSSSRPTMRAKAFKPSTYFCMQRTCMKTIENGCLYCSDVDDDNDDKMIKFKFCIRMKHVIYVKLSTIVGTHTHTHTGQWEMWTSFEHKIHERISFLLCTFIIIQHF